MTTSPQSKSCFCVGLNCSTISKVRHRDAKPHASTETSSEQSWRPLLLGENAQEEIQEGRSVLEKEKSHCFGVAFNLLLASATIFYIKFCKILLWLAWLMKWCNSLPWSHSHSALLEAVPTSSCSLMSNPEHFVKPDFQVLISGLFGQRLHSSQSVLWAQFST